MESLNREKPELKNETITKLNAPNPLNPSEDPYCMKVSWIEPNAEGEIETILGNVPEFIPSLDNFPENPTIVAFGKRRSGKTFGFRYIIEQAFKKIGFWIVLTDTKQNGFWQEMIPNRFIYNGLRKDVLLKIVERQEKLVKEYGPSHKNTKMGVIFDDVISDKTAMIWNTELNKFFTAGRHLGVTIFITTQYIKGIGPMLRNNADCAVILPTYNVNERVELRRLFGATCDNTEWDMMLDTIAIEKHFDGHTPQNPKKEVRSLVIKNWDNTPYLSEKFGWMVPKVPKRKFKLMRKYWNGMSVEENRREEEVVREVENEVDAAFDQLRLF